MLRMQPNQHATTIPTYCPKLKFPPLSSPSFVANRKGMLVALEASILSHWINLIFCRSLVSPCLSGLGFLKKKLPYSYLSLDKKFLGSIIKTPRKICWYWRLQSLVGQSTMVLDTNWWLLLLLLLLLLCCFLRRQQRSRAPADDAWMVGRFSTYALFKFSEQYN